MEKASSTSDQYDLVSPELGTQLLQSVSSIVLSVLDIVKAFDNPQTRDALEVLAKGYAPRSIGKSGCETQPVPKLGFETRIAPIKLAMEAAEPMSRQLKPLFRQYKAAIEESLLLKAKDDEIAFFFASCGFETASVANVHIYLREIRREMKGAACAPVARQPPVSASPSAPPTAAAKVLLPSDKAPTPPLAPEPSKSTSVDHGLVFNPPIARPGPDETAAAAVHAAKKSAASPNVEQPANGVDTGASAEARASYPAGYPFNMAANTPSEGQVGTRTDVNQSAGVARPPHREATSPQKRVKSPPLDIDDDDGFIGRSDLPYATAPHPLFASTSRQTHLDTPRPPHPTTNSNRDFVGSETSEPDDGFGADLQPRRIALARPPLTSPGTSSTVSPSGRAAAQLGAVSDTRRTPHPNAGSSASVPSYHVDYVQEGAGFQRSAAQPPPNRVPDDSDAQNDEDGPLPPGNLARESRHDR